MYIGLFVYLFFMLFDHLSGFKIAVCSSLFQEGLSETNNNNNYLYYVMVVYNNNRQNIIEKCTCGVRGVKLGNVQLEQYLFV